MTKFKAIIYKEESAWITKKRKEKLENSLQNITKKP